MKSDFIAENAEKKNKTISALSAVNWIIAPQGRWQTAAAILFHLLALALTARLAHWPYLLVLLTLALIIIPLALYSRLATHSPLHLATLSPCLLISLSPLYTVTILRLLVALIARALCPTCSPTLTVPVPFAFLLSFEWAAIFSLTLFVIRHSSLVIPSAYHAHLAAFALATLGLLWIAILFPRLIPAGVTGADPFAYVQMAIDLATRGTPTHNFPLARLAFDLNLPVYPTLPVGYTVPRAPTADSVTVWPPGFSVLLATAFEVFGERGLYALNPFIAVLCIIATYFFARRVVQLPPFYSLFASVLLLTSLEQTTRLSIPLADLAVQLFTTIAVLIAFGGDAIPSVTRVVGLLDVPKLPFRAPEGREGSQSIGKETPRFARSHTSGTAVLNGIFFALAFVTRYTQLLLAPGLLYLLFHRSNAATADRRQSPIVRRLLSFAIPALLIALPDFAYRSTAFGSPFSFAAGELAQFSAADIIPVAFTMLAELAADFNVAVPLIVLGGFALLRNHRRTALGLALTLGPVILFHLPYHYLKLRDLLFIFPILCALAALGLQKAVGSGQWAAGGRSLRFGVWRSLRHSPLFILHCSLFIVLAFRFNSQRPFLAGFYTYGFLTAEQRADIETIANLTPANAVIADSLNSGAVTLYAHRDTIRPGGLLQPGRTWTDSEFAVFANALHMQGRPLYLLMDSEEMNAPAAALSECCRLTAIAELYLPYYYRSGAATNEVVMLYRVDFRSTRAG